MQEADNHALKNIEDTAKDETKRVKQLAIEREELTESCLRQDPERIFHRLMLCFDIFCPKRELCDAGGRK